MKVLNVLNRFFKNILKYGASSKKLQNFHISPVLLTHSHRDVHQMNQILHIWRCVDSSGVAWTALALRMQLWRCVGSSGGRHGGRHSGHHAVGVTRWFTMSWVATTFSRRTVRMTMPMTHARTPSHGKLPNGSVAWRRYSGSMLGSWNCDEPNLSKCLR